MLTNREYRLRTICGALLAANMAMLVVFQAVRGGAGYDSLYGWVGNFTMLVPTAHLLRARVGGGPAPGPGDLARAGDALADGRQRDQLRLAAVSGQPPVPSPADIAYFGFYVASPPRSSAWCGATKGSFPRALWLDGVLGAAGAATALAAALSPVFSSRQGNLATVLVGSAYTAADLLLVAMICGLLVVRGTRGASLWRWLAGGLAIFCAADVVYALRVTSGIYSVGDAR